jgi:hypothetical protein
MASWLDQFLLPRPFAALDVPPPPPNAIYNLPTFAPFRPRTLPPIQLGLESLGPAPGTAYEPPLYSASTPPAMPLGYGAVTLPAVAGNELQLRGSYLPNLYDPSAWSSPAAWSAGFQLRRRF